MSPTKLRELDNAGIRYPPPAAVSENDMEMFHDFWKILEDLPIRFVFTATNRLIILIVKHNFSWFQPEVEHVCVVQRSQQRVSFRLTTSFWCLNF